MSECSRHKVAAVAWIKAAIAIDSSARKGNVADAHLDGVKERMWPDVPPDLLGVVNATGFDQQRDVALELRVARKGIRQIGAGKVLEDLGTITFVARLHSLPEG